MPERLTPGVYIEEVSGGVKPIQGVGTSTAAFIGEAARGIPDHASLITGFSGYDRLFGGHRRGEAGHLAQAVQAFFDAGGRRAYVVRVLPANATAGQFELLAARDADAWGLSRAVLRIDAKGNGVWSSHLRVAIEPATAFSSETFRLRVEWTEAGRTRTVETFDSLRMDPEHEDYAVEVVNDSSRYIQLTDLYASEFLDAEERSEPPIPERVAALDSVVAPAGGYRIAENARFEFRWSDAATGAGVGNGTDDPAEVVFDSATVTAAGGAFADGDAVLSAVQLQTLLSDVLGAQFRVGIPAAPASLSSEDGPFDCSDGNPAQLEIDAGANNLQFVQTTAASIDLGAGPFVLNADEVLQLDIDGGAQTYILVGGDITAGAATVAEMVTVLNREYTGIQAFDEGGNLTLRSDQRGVAATLAVSGTAAAGLGNPGVAQGAGNVSDPAAVTAAEIAAEFNAIANNPFEARVVGNHVDLVQIDLSAQHTLQWLQDPGPDPIITDVSLQTGPTTPPDPNVRVEPAVASRAYAIFRLQDGADSFDLSETDTINISASAGNGSGAELSAVDVNADANLTPAALAARINAVIAVGNDAYGLAADAAGDYLVLTSEAASGGVRIAIDSVRNPVNAAIAWRGLQVIPGAAGLLVDSHSAVSISVSEDFQLGVPRVLGGLFGNVRVAGLDENAATNPGLRPVETDDAPLRLLGGSDGSGLVSQSQYSGTVNASGQRSGLRALDTVDVNMLAIPGKTDAGFIAAGSSYCELNDVFFIADGPGSIDRQFEVSADEVRQVVDGLPTRSNNAAMYYPWIQVGDPVGIGRNPTRFIPPSGHVAGIFARTDINRGIWKAPAGIEAGVSGAIGLQDELLDGEQDLLNPIGLNCIRQFPGTGIVVWGSRTLASDPEWRYVPVRRTALFLKESLRHGMKWAVFEPNDQELWDRIRLNINAFMLSLFRQGAFQGSTPGEAFAVKCDRETNPQEMVDQGIVATQVSFAPLKPAEFVVIQISQKALVT